MVAGKDINSPAVNKLFRLDGRVALVTGAAGYLGKSMAYALAEAGAEVILNGRDQAKLEELADQMKTQGLEVLTSGFDLRSESAVRDFIAGVNDKYGRLDIIVNNAYSGITGTVETAKPEDFSASYEIAVTAAFRLIQTALPLLKKAAGENYGGASVINIASMYGTVSPDPEIYGDSGSNNPPFYGAAKAGLIQLTRYLACHLAGSKIRVNSISPGPFPPQDIAVKNPEFYQKLCGKNPMRRIGRSDELRGAVLFLASDASSYVTGVNLPVDGGWTAW